MNTYPKFNNEPEILKKETKVDELENLNYQTEKNLIMKVF